MGFDSLIGVTVTGPPYQSQAALTARGLMDHRGDCITFIHHLANTQGKPLPSGPNMKWDRDKRNENLTANKQDSEWS